MAATEAMVQLPADSTGKKIRTNEVVTTAGTVEQQVITIGDPSAIANELAVNADGSISTRLRDGAGNNVTSTLLQGRQGLDVIAQGDPDTVGSGTITAVDAVVGAPAGTGALLSGASTANSYVFLLCPGGDSAWNVQLTGTFGGTTVYFEESLDSTTGVDGNWIAVNGRQTGVVNTVLSNGVTTAGVFRGNTSGAKYLRLRAVGGAAPNIAVVIRMSSGTGAVFLNAGVPSGLDTIGAVALTSAVSGGTALANRPDAVLRIAMDGTSLLLDTFETLDTTNTWTTGGTVAPTQSAGALTLSAGTAASGSSYLRSQPAFTNGATAYSNFTSAFVLDAAAVTGNKRVWGLGIPATTPSVAAPLTNGVVFEILDTDGALYGVVYSNSVRTQSVLLTRPTDGAAHRYAIYFRASRVYFEVDSVAVGSISLPNPQIDAFPLVALSVNAAAGMPATAATLVASVMGLADTGRNNTGISDGTFPWRKLGINAAGAVRNADGAGNSLTSTAVGTSRPLDVNLAGSAGAIAQTAASITAAVGNTPGTAVTASTTAQVVANVAQAGNVTFHVVTSAFVGTLIFEASVDAGLNYSPVYCIREDGSGSETGTALNLAAAFIRQYSAALPGLAYFRVRCSAFTSGSVAVVLAPGPFLAEPNPSLAASSAVIGMVGPQPSTTGTITAPALAVTSFTALAANPNRKQAAFFNDSANVVYLALAATASTTAYTTQIIPSGYYELPVGNAVFTGLVSAIATVASGNLRVTELT